MRTASGDNRPFLLSATVDFPDDVVYAAYTPELLDAMMVLLKGMGVGRVYWLYYGDVDTESYWAGNLYSHPAMKYGPQTLASIGEPVKAAVPIAHRHGLELYAVLKPYNTGTSGSHPEGSSRPEATGLDRIGGTVWQAIPFAERYPGVRMRRRPFHAPAGLQTLPIRKIRLLKRDDSATRVRRENLQVWTSPDNYRYERRPVPFTLKEAVEPAPAEVRDYYGGVVTAKGAPVRTLTMEGLELTDRFVMVTTDFKDEDGDFRNTAVGMVEAYGPGPEPLPIVVATRSAVWERPRDFRTYGLDFDTGLGTFEAPLDVDNATMKGRERWSAMQSGGLIAFARGKNEYLASTPCEVYPEVRKLWSGWVERLIEAGVDGIDLRVSSHGNLTDEPLEYGFNEPVLDEYRSRYGSDPSTDGLDRLAKMRGGHFTSFVRETSRRIRQAGGKMQVHLHTEAFRPAPCHGQLMGFPPNVHFDWKTWLSEGLLDGVTFRTSWFEAMEDPPEGHANRSRLANALSDPVALEALEAVRQTGIPIYLNRYVDRAVGNEEYVSDMEAVFRDDRFDGFDLYEFAFIARPALDGAEMRSHEGRAELIRARAKKLGIA